MCELPRASDSKTDTPLTFQASLNIHSPVLSSNFQTLILDARYEFTDQNEDISCRDGRPLVNTTRSKAQPVEIVRGVGDEVVVRVLYEARLHCARSWNGTRSKEWNCAAE